MSKMTLMDSSIFDRGFMDQFFSPIKRRPVEGKGTKDEPFIIKRSTIIDRTYHGWYDDEGGYHETFQKEE